jgi:hypothetical protein
LIVSNFKKGLCVLPAEHKAARGWKAMRPEGLEAKNNSSRRACQLPGLPASQLSSLIFYCVFSLLLKKYRMRTEKRITLKLI